MFSMPMFAASFGGICTPSALKHLAHASGSFAFRAATCSSRVRSIASSWVAIAAILFLLCRGAVTVLRRGMPGGPRISMPYSEASSVIQGDIRWLGRGGRVLAPLGGLCALAHEFLEARRLGDEQEPRLLELTVKVCGISPWTVDEAPPPADALITWPSTQRVNSPSIT